MLSEHTNTLMYTCMLFDHVIWTIGLLCPTVDEVGYMLVAPSHIHILSIWQLYALLLLLMIHTVQ